MTNWAQTERDLLCDAMLAAGPDAPTLCGDWAARDLAAHLVLRERRPLAAAGIVLKSPLVTRHTDKVQQQLAGSDWTGLVSTLRSGPPWWSPTAIGPIDELTNTVEFFVHHEDLRRGAASWEPRQLDPAFETVLGRALGRLKVLVRRSPVGVRFCTPDGTVRLERSGPDTVTVTGPASELVLYAYGRQRHSRVELSGAEAGTRALQDASLGI
jgi:uncharacterized protein (TIGR03085 family)